MTAHLAKPFQIEDVEKPLWSVVESDAICKVCCYE